MKSEIRNPKSERNPKAEIRSHAATLPTLFGTSDFGLLSDFGFRASDFRRLLLILTAAALLVGCSSARQTPQQRADAAKALFDHATKYYHIPSAEAQGAEKTKLQEQAVAAYEQLVKKYPDQAYWAAQALRSLGNIRAAQTNLNEAVKLYASVEKKYPQQEWDVLMALKSAADLLWDAGPREEAKRYYQKIVSRYDQPEAPAVVKTVVRGSKTKLAGGDSRSD